MKEESFDQALIFLREAYVQHSAQAVIKVKMAICHLKMGETALAVKFLDDGLSKDSSLIADFTYYYPKGSYSKDIEHVIQKYKP